jgi:hypothetical protein
MPFEDELLQALKAMSEAAKQEAERGRRKRMVEIYK